MTILSTIRSRVGLLVGIIFLALLSFVLTDLLSSQRGLFGGSGGDNTVGIINGNEITTMDFHNRMEEISQGKSLSQQEQDRYSEGIWQEMIDKYIFEPQFEELGITITDDELAEQMYGDRPSPYMNQFFQDPQTGQINPQFAGPDGMSLSGKAIREFVKKMPEETERQWAQIERDLRKTLLREKYNALLRKGIYVTTAEAKREYADENTKYNFKFIVRKFSEIADSTIKPTDEELKEYYNAHQDKFKQRDNMRTMEYVAFDIFPSADDIANQRKAMEDLVTTFKAQKPAEDSAFVVANSETQAYTKTDFHPGQYPAGSDSAFLKAAPGDVLGPFSNGENLTIYKVLSQYASVDSVRVRHILVGYKQDDKGKGTQGVTRTKAEAKMRADSILRVIKGGKKIEDLVWKLTDDQGSKNENAKPDEPGYKGDYGWFDKDKQFVQEFKDAGFNNPKGAVVIAETNYGYHVIQVVDKSSESTKVKVVAIEQKVEPSDKTIRTVFSKAQEFAGKNNTDEAFKAAVKKDNLQVFPTDPILENAKTINGIENPKDVIRWLYEDKTEVGTVSPPFQNTTRYFVAHATKILNKGVKPFEEQEVKDICLLEVRKQKKAQKFTDELNKVKGATIEQWGANANLPVMPAVGVTFSAPYVQGAGYENAIIGAVVALENGKNSAPVMGSAGVYVVMREAVTPAPPIPDVKAQQKRLIEGFSSRVDATASEVLKDAADITDHRAKHF